MAQRQTILLSGSGSARIAKVADFGLAKAFDDAGLSNFTATGTRAGSPWYMPRQQVVRFKSADPAVDVWAMAATPEIEQKSQCGARVGKAEP